MNCDWDETGRHCRRCGKVMSPRAPAFTIRDCRPSGEGCQHFLGATKEAVLVFGCGCAAASVGGVPVTVCECELEAHPRCITFNRGTHLSDETVMRCSHCQDNTANSSHS